MNESKGVLKFFQNSDSFYDPCLVVLVTESEDFDFFEVSLQGSQDKIIAHLLFVGVPAIDRKGEEVLATLLLVGDLNPVPLVECRGVIAGNKLVHAFSSVDQPQVHYTERGYRIPNLSSTRGSDEDKTRPKVVLGNTAAVGLKS